MKQEDVEAPTGVNLSVCIAAVAFPAQLFTYGAWLSYSRHAREAGMIYLCLFK